MTGHRGTRPCLCLRCLKPGIHQGRGLCVTCYAAVHHAGGLADYERTLRSRDEVLDEWDRLRADGWTIPNAAHRMGMTPKALDQAITRGKRLGDPRARRTAA